MEAGFIKANRENLPKVNCLTVAHYFITNRESFLEESRNIKNSLTPKEDLGDNAIGYVCLKRESSICTVKGKVFSNKICNRITINVDENDSVVTDAKCHNCSNSGCMHAAAFVLWVHRRSEEPEDSRSLWKKPFNAYKVKFITVSQMTGNNTEIESDPALLKEFIKEAKRRNIKNCLLLKHSETLKYNKELFEE